MSIVGLIVVVILAALGMWIVQEFSAQLGTFLTKLFRVVIIAFCVLAVLSFVLGLFGVGWGTVRFR